MNDSQNLLSGHTKATTDRAERVFAAAVCATARGARDQRAEPTNFVDFVRRQLRAAVLIALGVMAVTTHATFAFGIGHVVVVRAQEQVQRIDAEFDVAVMTDEPILRQIAKDQFVCDAMGETSLRSRARSASDVHTSIIVAESTTLPQPAAIWLDGHFAPERAGERHRLSVPVSTVERTIAL